MITPNYIDPSGAIAGTHAAKGVECAASIGEALFTERTRLGYTLREIAEKSGVSPSTISRVENGHHDTTAVNLFQICHALGICVVIGRVNPKAKAAKAKTRKRAKKGAKK